eukprot:TRINITY_DN29770_c0_g1_i1.p1 TRINITY_DN29770_c0_g1~~TRINITY_DN29770_c0_g1_i1.p1  ORF type:complete len:248 (-),score=34.49 TRINITY_DN29770_c0_g1_i1:162-905(-)
MAQPQETTEEGTASGSAEDLTRTEATPTPALSRRLFRGHDPFSEFSPDPFSGGGSHRVFGSAFGRVMHKLQDLSEEILGVAPTLPPQESSHVPGAARYSVQTASMNSWTGEDGRVHTEQFVTSDVGDRSHGIRETHQAYANSATGEQQRALEQHLGQRGLKTVKKRVGREGAEEHKDMILGMEDTADAREGFAKDFNSNAEHLPQHQSFSGEFFTHFETGSRQGLTSLPGKGGWLKDVPEHGHRGGS